MMNNNAALGAYLKQATRAQHQHLDQHPRLFPLLQSGLQLSDYRSALTGLYMGQVALEDAIQTGLNHLQLRYPLVLRTPALRRDLCALNVPLPTLLPLSIAKPLPLRTLGQLVGALYVLEGAKLGSRVIARNVQRRLGLQVPSEFFTGHDALAGDCSVAKSWSHFWTFSKSHCPQHQWSIAALAAQQAFQLFLTGLDTQRGVELAY